VVERPVSLKTGLNRLDALSGVFEFLLEEEHPGITANPVLEFRR